MMMTHTRIVLAAAAVAALGASGVANAAEYARVVSAKPVTESVSVPRQECVSSQQVVQHPPSGGGAVVGALVGGLLGNQFGHGFGRAAATGAGAVAGAAVGNSVEVGANPPTVVPTQQCRTVTGQESRVVAYDVVYEYHGQRYATRLPEDPGPRLAVDVRPAGNAAVEPSSPTDYGAVPPATYGAVPPAYAETAPIVNGAPPPVTYASPPAYYPAPPFKSTGVGRFYVTPTGNDVEELKQQHNEHAIADLAAHEGFPGHDWHYKVMTQYRDEISPLRWLTPGAVEDSSSMWEDSMAAEGWALYAEQLAVEMGEYTNDPMGHIGQLHDSMLRAVRLVVDTGIHAFGWSRDRALEFAIEHVPIGSEAIP